MATFRQLTSGKWQARVFRNGKYESIGTFQTKKEAEVKAGQIEKQIYYNEAPTDRNMLFQEVIDDWFKLKKSVVKESTFTQLEVIKRLHIEPFFGKYKLYQISRNDVNNWIKEYEELTSEDGSDKYSYGARLKYLVTLKDIFNHAVYVMEVLHKNPATKTNIPTRGKVSIKQNVKYHNLEELNILLDYLAEYEPPRYKDYKIYYVLIYLLSRTGMRISEALALKWSDIEGNRIDINKQTTRDDNNRLVITSLKTISSYRNIEIDDSASEMLVSFRKLQQKMIMKHKEFKRNEDLIIFQTYNGNYMTPSTVRETLKSLCLRAGIEYKGTHAFRHTHAVLGLESGADLVYISKRLGHGSIQTTSDTYLDITPQYETNELNKIAMHLDSNMARSWQTGTDTK